MVKWADYGISEVKYNDRHTRIIAVKVREDLGDNFGKEMKWARLDVVTELKKGKTIITIPPGSNGDFKQGAMVKIFRLGGEEFIKTEDNDKKEDNLGELPEF